MKLHQISVVVTNFNYGHLVGRCIRSLLNQTLPLENFEIVVVDDCSTDDSVSILRNFGDQITLLELPENKGLAHASNSGIERCISRYIVRVDADDYVHPKFLETLLLGFELFGGSCEAVSCDYLEVDDSGAILGASRQVEKPIACAIAFKIDSFEALGFYDSNLRINEEIDLMERFNKAKMRIYNINLPLYRYVQHSQSLTKRVPK